MSPPPLERLVVHIGHDKTGTTSLQETLQANAAALARCGVCYPAMVHHPVAEEFGVGGAPFAPGAAWAAFRAAAVRSGCPVAVLSTEGLVRLRRRNVDEALAAFAALARQVEVVLYLRHPVHYANSAVSQGLRLGRTLDDLAANPPIIDQKTIVQRWRNGVTDTNLPARLEMRIFRRDTDRTFSLVDDMLGRLGLGANIDEAVPLRAVANRGFSVLACHVLDWINRQPRDEALDQASLAAFNTLEGPGYVLPDAARAIVRERTRPALTWLEERHGVRLEERAEPATPPCVLSEAELASLARLLLRTTQFAFEVERARVAWWLGLRAPVTVRALRHPVHDVLKRLKLTGPLLGEGGRRAKTVDKRLLAAPREARPAPGEAPPAPGNARPAEAAPVSGGAPEEGEAARGTPQGRAAPH